MTTSNEISHDWEQYGFKAPYRCVGMYSLPSSSLAEHNPSAYMLQLQAAPKGYGIGSCSVCYTALMNNYLMNDANGKKFVVGCDCVLKTHNYKLIREMKSFKRDAETNKRIAKKAAETKARLNAEREKNGGLTDAEVVVNTRQAERDAYYALHAEFFDKVKATENAFALDILQTVVYFKNMSVRQEEILKQSIVEHSERLSSKNEHFGVIGTKIERELTVKNIFGFEGVYGRQYIVTLKDSEGRTFKYAGSTLKAFPDINEKAVLKFTISSHDEYRETKQTVIQRVKTV